MKSSPDHQEEVRQRVITTASEAFLSHGIKSVTMDEIARTLSMSKRTLYQMFSDKDDLLLACFERRDQEKELEMQELMKHQSNVLEFLLTMLAGNLNEMRRVKPSFYVEITKYPKVLAYFDRKHKAEEKDAVLFLNKGIEQGYFREDINFRIVYNQLSEGINTMGRNEVLQSFSQIELFRNTVLVYLRGCSTLKGIEMIDGFIHNYRDQLFGD